MLKSHFQMLAQYNALANQRLYAACAQLTEEERQQVRPAFFQSIHRTLNHILVGDRIWLGRFEHNPVQIALDTILYQDFEELRTARFAEDERIITFTAGLTAEFLASTIEYRNSQGIVYQDSLSLLIAHFFNHQTHHRGQVHDLLTQTQVPPPSLDMHRIINP
jgi:uncharacterized damage-inducible protein DinB